MCNKLSPKLRGYLFHDIGLLGDGKSGNECKAVNMLGIQEARMEIPATVEGVQQERILRVCARRAIFVPSHGMVSIFIGGVGCGNRRVSSVDGSERIGQRRLKPAKRGERNETSSSSARIVLASSWDREVRLRLSQRMLDAKTRRSWWKGMSCVSRDWSCSPEAFENGPHTSIPIWQHQNVTSGAPENCRALFVNQCLFPPYHHNTTSRLQRSLPHRSNHHPRTILKHPEAHIALGLPLGTGPCHPPVLNFTVALRSVAGGSGDHRSLETQRESCLGISCDTLKMARMLLPPVVCSKNEEKAILGFPVTMFSAIPPHLGVICPEGTESLVAAGGQGHPV
ncbi:hypothetical protein DFH09DRAFT_1073001 [Mycena vulgaris]|nr:hypothetical protein DFH09DRAFT_1073001 [Mycena vulgaris]